MRTFLVGVGLLVAAASLPAQQMVTDTRDPAQQQDAEFEKSVKEWTGKWYGGSPLVDHLSGDRSAGCRLREAEQQSERDHLMRAEVVKRR